MSTTAAVRRKTAAPAYFKALTDGEPAGTFEAIVAVFNNVDLGGDRIIPGAFEKSLARWKASGDPIPVIFSHQWDDLYAHVGTVDPADAKELLPGDPSLPAELKGLGGLYVKGSIEVDAPGEAGHFATTLWSKMARRAIKEFSFAYDIEAARPTKDALELTELDLIEVGPTLKGMNPATALLDAKAARAAVDGLSPRKALELLDSLIPPPPPAPAKTVDGGTGSTTAPTIGTVYVDVVPRLAKSIPGGPPAGAIEATLKAIKDAATVWANLEYGNDLYFCHLEATYLADGKALITAERWQDPFGEGPLWELAFTLDDKGAQITGSTPVELEVNLRPAAPKARARKLLEAGVDLTAFAAAQASASSAAAVTTVTTDISTTEAKDEEPEAAKSEEPTERSASPLEVMLELEELEL